MLGIFQVGLREVYLGIDVAVGHQHVKPTIIVHVEKSHAAAEQAGVNAKSAGIGTIFEDAIAEIGVKGVGVAGEIGFHNVEIAAAVVVANGNAHARLRLGLGG